MLGKKQNGLGYIKSDRQGTPSLGGTGETGMTDVERYLRSYWFATRSIGRLLFDLDAAKAAYTAAQEYLPSSLGAVDESGVKTQQHESAVETAAIIAASQYKAEVMSIERRLTAERAQKERIEQAVADAKLDAREQAYVRIRYFENRRVQAVAQRLYCSCATCGRIRERVLERIGHVLEEAET